MTSTTQKEKNVNNNSTKLAEKSFIHIRRVLAAAVSTITDIRELVPKTAYNEKYFYDMPLKILSNKNGDKCPASTIIDWMNGAFQAIAATYLKEMRLLILRDANDITSVIEEYTFRFNYPNGDISSTLTMNKNNKGSNALEAGLTQDTLRDIKKFMRDLWLFTRSVDDLPKQVQVTLRLKYNENAPEGYQPDGYKANDPNEHEYLMKSHKLDEIDIGQSINFGRHSMKLTAGVGNKKTMSNVDSTQYSEGFRLPQDTLQESCNKKTMMDDDPDGIRCPCGYNNDINNVCSIRCGICSLWQHAICFSLPNENDCPSFHICHNCADVTDQNRLPTDFSLMDKTPGELIYMCTWRRAILAVMGVDKLTVLSLRKLLNCTKVIAKKIVDQFQQSNIFIPSSSEKKMKEIDHAKLSDLFRYEITEISAMNKQKRQGMNSEETPMKYDSNSMEIETPHGMAMDTRPQKQIFAPMDTPSQEQFKLTKRKRGASRRNTKRSKQA